MPELTKRTPLLAGSLALALLLSACGGGDEESEGTAEANVPAADAPGEEHVEAEPEIDPVDPMELAPDNLCTVLSPETLDELLGEDSLRHEDTTTNGIPEESDLEELDRLRMVCMHISALGFNVTLSMEVTEGPYADSRHGDVSESDADPGTDLGDFAVVDVDEDGAVQVDVVEGQVFLRVKYSNIQGAEGDVLREGALLAAEEILEAVG